jgi:hypothetical protein
MDARRSEWLRMHPHMRDVSYAHLLSPFTSVGVAQAAPQLIFRRLFAGPGAPRCFCRVITITDSARAATATIMARTLAPLGTS